MLVSVVYALIYYCNETLLNLSNMEQDVKIGYEDLVDVLLQAIDGCVIIGKKVVVDWSSMDG